MAADDGANLDGSSPPPPPSGRFTFSQLLLITTRPDRYQWYLHSYSAATCSWGGAPTPCLDGRYLSHVGEGPAVVNRGAAHWLMSEFNESMHATPRGDDRNLCKLSVELGGGSTARVSLTKLPVPVRARGTLLLHVIRDGKLSVACMYPVHATVWTQQDGDGAAGEDDDAAWVRTQVFLIPMVAAPYSTDSPGLHHWSDEWYDFDMGSVIVLGRNRGVFILDLEKVVTEEKVIDWFPRLYAANKQVRKCVPYEMDLMDFFARLGGLLCRG